MLIFYVMHLGRFWSCCFPPLFLCGPDRPFNVNLEAHFIAVHIGLPNLRLVLLVPSRSGYLSYHHCAHTQLSSSPSCKVTREWSWPFTFIRFLGFRVYHALRLHCRTFEWHGAKVQGWLLWNNVTADHEMNLAGVWECLAQCRGLLTVRGVLDCNW